VPFPVPGPEVEVEVERVVERPVIVERTVEVDRPVFRAPAAPTPVVVTPAFTG
jgi:hypothetical protein